MASFQQMFPAPDCADWSRTIKGGFREKPDLGKTVKTHCILLCRAAQALRNIAASLSPTE